MHLHHFFICLFFSISTYSYSQEVSPKYEPAKELMETAWTIMYTKPDSSLLCLRQAIPVMKELAQWEDYIQGLNTIAIIYYFTKNEAFFEATKTAVLEAEKYLEADSPDYATALSNYGLAFRLEKGNYDKALALYNKALAAHLKGSNKIDIAATYQNISVCYRNKGDYDEGSNYLKKALQYFIDTLGENHSNVARIYSDMGHIQRDKENWSQALSNYYRFLALVEEGNSKIKVSSSTLIYCYQSMSRIYTDQARYDSSEYYLQKAFSFHERGVKKREIQSYEALGHFHSKQLKYAEAVKDYQTAAELAVERFKKSKNIAIGRTYRSLGQAYADSGEFKSALAAYQKGIIGMSLDFEDSDVKENPAIAQFTTNAQALDLIEGKAAAFRRLFVTSNVQEDLLLARQNYQLAAQLINEQRRNFLADGSKHTLAGKALAVYEGAIETALELHQLSRETGYLEEAFSYAERNKSMLLLESLQENVAKVAGRLSEEDLNQEKDLNSEIAFTEKKIIEEKRKGEKKNAEKIKKWENDLFDLRQLYQQLVASFEQKYPSYYQLKHNVEPSKVQDLRQSLISPENALLEYFVGKDHIFVFCITSEAIKVEKVRKSKQLSEALLQLTGLISQPPFGQDLSTYFSRFSEYNWTISEQLLLPSLAGFDEKIRHLIIIPDDQLAYLPFELLLSQQPQSGISGFSLDSYDYILKRYAISYNYSATLLQNHLHPKHIKGIKPMIGFAPSFSEGPSITFRGCSDDQVYSLQCNEEEVSAIMDIFDGNQKLGLAANIEAFKEMAGNYRIIHLATHACAGESDALNKIYFSDGYLTNFDLNTLDLNAELAVLSACNTGSGQLVKGEGVMSLSRGFILANCPSTLMSLWTVDDCITADLMVGFYQKIKEGFAKDEALRLTKLEHLQTADKAGLHPYYWAAFLQSGNPEPMYFSSSWSYWWAIGLLAAVLFLVFSRKKK